VTLYALPRVVPCLWVPHGDRVLEVTATEEVLCDGKNRMTHAINFESQRPALFGLAYRMLGSASEAEDVLQDAFLRVHTAARGDIRKPEAYLRTIVTRLCLDRLKAARTSREQYPGPWLPEPLLTAPPSADPQHTAEQHESITQAFLVLLEALTPQERAVLLLRDVFGYDYTEIAEILQLQPANCRQVLHRARAHLVAHRPRFEVATEQHHTLVARFLAATERGDVEALTQVLADDVTLWSDGGGKMPAPRKPVVGKARVASVLLFFATRIADQLGDARDTMRATVAYVNAEPAILVWVGQQLDSVMVCELAEERIANLRLIRNPEKLRYIASQLGSTMSAS
jgi:RNA polymerase sigma-70 factor, ECF subfamily